MGRYTITSGDPWGGDVVDLDLDRVAACDRAKQDAAEILATSCAELRAGADAIDYVRAGEHGYSRDMLDLVCREIERQCDE